MSGKTDGLPAAVGKLGDAVAQLGPLHAATMTAPRAASALASLAHDVDSLPALVAQGSMRASGKSKRGARLVVVQTRGVGGHGRQWGRAVAGVRRGVPARVWMPRPCCH
jgi:hypothetical protein